MIKKLIFDVDNTLIDFPKEYVRGYQEVLDKNNIKKSFIDLYNALGKYETCGLYKYYKIEDVLNLINKELGLNLDKKFSDDYFKMYDNLITPVSDSTIKTLEYLSKKYELVVLSNWFTKSQENRLRKAGLLKYFTKVYGTDIVPMKPLEDSFLSVVGDLKVEECAMIGDNFDVDIKVPYELGMNVFYLNKDGIKVPNITTIKSIDELKEML